PAKCRQGKAVSYGSPQAGQKKKGQAGSTELFEPRAALRVLGIYEDRGRGQGCPRTCRDFMMIYHNAVGPHGKGKPNGSGIESSAIEREKNFCIGVLRYGALRYA